MDNSDLPPTYDESICTIPIITSFWFYSSIQPGANHGAYHYLGRRTFSTKDAALLSNGTSFSDFVKARSERAFELFGEDEEREHFLFLVLRVPGHKEIIVSPRNWGAVRTRLMRDGVLERFEDRAKLVVVVAPCVAKPGLRKRIGCALLKAWRVVLGTALPKEKGT